MDWEENCSNPVNTMVTHMQLLLHLQTWPSAIVCVCVCVCECVSLSFSGAQVICLVGCYQSFLVPYLAGCPCKDLDAPGYPSPASGGKESQSFEPEIGAERRTKAVNKNSSSSSSRYFCHVKLCCSWKNDVVPPTMNEFLESPHSDSHRLFPDNSILILRLQVGVLLMGMQSRLLPLVWREKRCARSEQERKHWRRNSESSDCGTGRRDDDKEARESSLWGERERERERERDVLLLLRWCEPGGAERDTQGIRSVPSLRLPCRSCRVR